MKASSIPTEYVIVRASTSSQYDQCSFILIHRTQAWLDTMKARLHTLELLKNQESFSHISYWDAPLGFYSFSAGAEEAHLQRLTGDGSDWGYIELLNSEVPGLLETSEALEADTCTLTSTGYVSYKATGKYNCELYISESIKLSDLL